MRIVSSIFVVVFVAIMLVGQQVREDRGADYDITNVTSKIVWNHTFTPSNESVAKIVDKLADTFGFVITEGAKVAVRYGFEHPEYNFKFMFDLALWYLYITFAIMVFPAIIAMAALCWVIFEKGREIMERRKR